MARLIRTNPKSRNEVCFIQMLKHDIIFYYRNRIMHSFKESELKYIAVRKMKIEGIERIGDKLQN